MVGNVHAVLDLDRGVQVVSVRETWLDTGSAATVVAYEVRCGSLRGALW
jgi:hypothetical protein